MVIAILDIDGTLVDTNYHHTIAWYRAFRRHGIVLPIWRIHRHIGMGGDHVIGALTDERTEREYGDEIRASEAELYGEVIGEVETMAGSRELLMELKRRGHTVVLASSAKEQEVEPKRAGVGTFAVLTGGFAARELRDAGALAVFESVADLCKQLDQTTLR
jgi:phosphoglycolate phosphatase-like HAD superfamily hydrolase